MKYRVPIITTCLIGAGLLAVATLVSVEQKTFAAEPPADPAYTAHSAHVAAGASQAGGQPPVEAQLADILARLQRLEAITRQEAGKSPHSGAMPTSAGNSPPMRPMPGMGSGVKPAPAGMAGMNMTGGGKSGMGGSPAVSDQLAELRSKMQRLETAIQQQSTSSADTMPMSGRPGMGSGTKPMPPGMAGMTGMGVPGGTKPGGGMGSMGGGAAAPGGGMGMMGMMGMKMDKMMGMMDKMMGGMGGSPKPAAAAPMAGGGMPMMDDDMMEMGGMGGGAAPAGAPMAGGGMGMMGMDKMEMAGMMGMMGGMGGSSMAMPSALPGFPGASHLYHLGATGFFLDHPQHIALSIEQQAALNQIKEQAGLDKASVNRSAQEAEQDLWTLTAADQPDNAQIEAKVAEIEKLKGDGRLRFISAIGSAAKILNDSQRQSLTGFAPPAPAAPAAAPMAGGMTDM